MNDQRDLDRLASFEVSTFVVVESLEPHEPRTGEATVQYLAALVQEAGSGQQIRLVTCPSADGFRSLISDLKREAFELQLRPLLHIECHGSETSGLEFADGSQLAWEELGALLASLNMATQFNLFVVVAACYGFHLNGSFSAIDPAPALCIAAPIGEVGPAELLQAFRVFYRTLLTTNDAGLATQELAAVPIEGSGWFSQLAEEWFEHLVVNYVKTHLAKPHALAWARDLARRERAKGRALTARRASDDLLQAHRQKILGKYFEVFFCINLLPANAQRFDRARQRLEKRLQQLRMTGEYYI